MTPPQNKIKKEDGGKERKSGKNDKKEDRLIYQRKRQARQTEKIKTIITKENKSLPALPYISRQ